MSASTEVAIEWNAVSRARYVRLTETAGRSALEQSWDFGETVAAHHGQRTDRAVLSADGKPIALLQAVTGRLMPGLELARITRGPVWLAGDVPPAVRDAVFATIRSVFGLRRRRLLLWLPELPDGRDSAAALQRLGMRRMVTGYSTIWMNLQADDVALRAGLDGKWRNILNRAEREELAVQPIFAGPALDELIDAYRRTRRRRRFAGASAAFVAMLAARARARDDIVAVRAMRGGAMVSGALFVRHGASATYLVGWTGDDGRRLGAGHLTLWRGLLALKEAKTKWLDLGGIDAGAPGIARFKLGLGGEPVTLTGTWL